jgi:hypothetical protein
MTLEIDDDTQRELIMAAARAAGFLSNLLAADAISEAQRYAAQRMAENIQAAVTAAIKAQKVAA